MPRKPRHELPEDNPAAREAAERIGDPAFEAKLKDLTPEQIEMFLEALRVTMRKRRIMLLGYLAALIGIVLGMVVALLVYANREPGTFVGWVFLVPFLLAGLSMVVFGRLARNVKIAPAAPAAERAESPDDES